MNRPAELQQLLLDLKAEKPDSAVVTTADSRMVVVVDEPEARYDFNAGEAQLLLANKDTVDRLFEALEYPDEAFVELYTLEIDVEVMEALEKYVATVDEL